MLWTKQFQNSWQIKDLVWLNWFIWKTGPSKAGTKPWHKISEFYISALVANQPLRTKNFRELVTIGLRWDYLQNYWSEIVFQIEIILEIYFSQVRFPLRNAQSLYSVFSLPHITNFGGIYNIWGKKWGKNLWKFERLKLSGIMFQR